MKYIALGLILFSAITFSFAPAAFAEDAGSGVAGNGNAGSGITGGNAPTTPSSNIDSVPKVIQLIQKITNWMFTIFMAVAAAMVIYAAFIYLTSGGGEEVGTAHKMLLYAAIAIAVATVSRGFVKIVENFTNV